MTSPIRKTIKAPDRRRRRHDRYRAEFSVTATFLEGNEYRKLGGHCRDLSESGIGMLLAAEINNGEVVGLHFTLPGTDMPLEIRAVVRYRRSYHYGVEFLSLNHQQREVLKCHLEGLEPVE